VKSLRLDYQPLPDVTPEDEARILGEAYRFVLRAYEEKKKGARPGTPDDVKKGQDVHTANHILP
jgi:hypothetical protein